MIPVASPPQLCGPSDKIPEQVTGARTKPHQPTRDKTGGTSLSQKKRDSYDLGVNSLSRRLNSPFKGAKDALQDSSRTCLFGNK